MNIEHRTSNVQRRIKNKDQTTEHSMAISVTFQPFPPFNIRCSMFDVHLSNIEDALMAKVCYNYKFMSDQTIVYSNIRRRL